MEVVDVLWDLCGVVRVMGMLCCEKVVGAVGVLLELCEYCWSYESVVGVVGHCESCVGFVRDVKML